MCKCVPVNMIFETPSMIEHNKLYMYDCAKDHSLQCLYFSCKSEFKGIRHLGQ